MSHLAECLVEPRPIGTTRTPCRAQPLIDEHGIVSDVEMQIIKFQDPKGVLGFRRVVPSFAKSGEGLFPAVETGQMERHPWISVV